MSVIGQEVRIHDVEPGRRYRFTFAKAIMPGSRSRTVEATVEASFWGEVPLATAFGIIRVDRSLVRRIVEVF